MPGFYDYFRENMEALGLPAPATLYGNLTTALATAGTLVGLVEKFGTKVTVADVAGAGFRSEQLLAVGAVAASFYTGAVIGSLAVATGRTLADSTSMADVINFAAASRLNAPWLATTLARNPQLCGSRVCGPKTR